MLTEVKNQTINENKTNSKKLYIQSYGCQMNFSDSEVVASILKKEGYDTTPNPNEASLILINTCSIREKAEQTVRRRISDFKKNKLENDDLIIGILGCMAERLKEKFLEQEKIVDLVIGPDAYRDLPKLIKQTKDGRKAVNVILSKEETYGDINPIRLNSNGVNAFASIMPYELRLGQDKCECGRIYEVSSRSHHVGLYLAVLCRWQRGIWRKH